MQRLQSGEENKPRTSLQPSSTERSIRFSSYEESTLRRDAIDDDRWDLIDTVSRLTVIVLALILASCWPLLLYPMQMLIPVSAFLFAIVTVPGTEILSRRRFKRRMWHLRMEADLPGGGVQFSTKVEVKYNSVVTCKDVGIVTFMDGYLLFSGLRTSFGLRSQDVVKKFSTSELVASLPGNLTLNIVFQPMEALSETTPALTAPKTSTQFMRRWQEWQNGPEEEIPESTFPPARIYSSPFVVATKLLSTALFAVSVSFFLWWVGCSLTLVAMLGLEIFFSQLIFRLFREFSLKRFMRPY